MSVPWDGAQTQAITTPRTTRVQLEISPAEETIRGRLAVEGGPPSDFYGWLELINALERATNPRGAQAKPFQAAQ